MNVQQPCAKLFAGADSCTRLEFLRTAAKLYYPMEDQGRFWSRSGYMLLLLYTKIRTLMNHRVPVWQELLCLTALPHCFGNISNPNG
jgi:hypothetical protein